MMPMQWDEDFGPLDGRAYQTRAVNLPVRDGEIEKIELLLTPDAAIDGLPENPRVLYTRDCTGTGSWKAAILILSKSIKRALPQSRPLHCN